MDCAFDILCKKASPYSKSSRFSLIVSSDLTVLCFMYRHVVNFDFILWRCKVLARFFPFFFFFACEYSVVPAPFVAETIFVPLCCLSSFAKISWLFIFLSVCYIALIYSLFFHHCHTWSELCQPSTFFFSFNTMLYIMSLLFVHISFRISSLIYIKLDWNCIKSANQVDKNWPLDTTDFFPILKHETCLYLVI